MPDYLLACYLDVYINNASLYCLTKCSFAASCVQSRSYQC